jgi:hypothetical protein
LTTFLILQKLLLEKLHSAVQQIVLMKEIGLEYQQDHRSKEDHL